jgi:hypothetical protein
MEYNDSITSHTGAWSYSSPRGTLSAPERPLQPDTSRLLKRPRFAQLIRSRLDRYRYQPLIHHDDFRILVLFPSVSGFDEIQCSLRMWDRKEPYEAVSYIWGQGPPDQDIAILPSQPNQQRRYIHIMSNLYSALRHLRLREKPRLLWVDAICINQEDVAEKNSQLRYMSNIMNQAYKVCIWLGPSLHNTDIAFHFVPRLLQLTEFDRIVTDYTVVREWEALMELLAHPYFQRRWCVQDVAQARRATLHCGDYVLDWNDFADAVTMLERYEGKEHGISRLFRDSGKSYTYFESGDIQSLGAVRLVYAVSNIFRKSEAGIVTQRLLSLENLVHLLATFRTSDPRDVIYALIPLARDVPRQSYLNIDGNRNLTAPPIQGGVAKVSFASVAFMLLAARRAAATWKKHIESRHFSGGTQQLLTQTRATTTDHNLWEGSGNLPRSRSPYHMVFSTIPLRTHTEDQPKHFSEVVFRLLATQRAIAKWKRIAEDHYLTTTRALRVRDPTKGLPSTGLYPIDYSKSYFDVCKDFVRFVIYNKQSLDIICRPWAPSSHGLHLPSWISTLEHAAFGPQVRDGRFERINADPLVNAPGKSPYNASGGYAAHCYFHKGSAPSSLFAQGFVLDTVHRTQAAAIGGSIHPSCLKFGGWLNRNDLPPERFWRTVVADRGPDGSYPPLFYRRACQHVFNESGINSVINTEQLLWSNPSSTVEEFLRRMQEVVWNRALIKTKREYFGLAPMSVESGDLVCILYGCSVPVILRKMDPLLDEAISVPDDDSSDLYQIIGDCYLHNMMDGEALTAQRTQWLPNRMFEIR